MNITDLLATPWKATHIVYQIGNGELKAGSNRIRQIQSREIIEGGVSYPFRIHCGDEFSISVTATGTEWCNSMQSGWWCVELTDKTEQAIRDMLEPKPATPEPEYDERVAEYDEYMVGQKVRIAPKSNLRGNIFGTVTEDAGLIGVVVETGIRGNQGIRVETKRKGKSPSRYIYQAKHLLLLEEKGKGKPAKPKKDKGDPLAKLIAKRMSKTKVGDRVMIIGDIAAKHPALASGWTDSMYEKIGTIGTVDSLHSRFEVVVDGYIYHVLDLVKV